MSNTRPADPETDRTVAADLEEVRLGQARLLHQRTRTSCLTVEAVILYLTVLIMLGGDRDFAALWCLCTSAMVGVVYIYPSLAAPGGVTESNYRRYLRGHVVISGLTGLLWGGFACAFLDPNSLLHLFITINIVFSISVGGMLPSAEYRPSFISLASGTLLPFAAYWLVVVDGPLRLIGIGLLIYYGFGLLLSARAEVQTIESIAAERHRRLTRKLQEQNRLIEKASAAKSRFLAATSHDMSQPLQAQGFFIGALRRMLDRPEQAELLDKIEASWRSQQALLQALVETARLDSGAITVRPRTFEIAAVLETLESEFAEMARAKSITLDVRPMTGAVTSDPLLVTRILRNLLSNALKFTPAGGQVEVYGRTGESTLTVEVCDTGPGIAPDAQKRIFEEYVQLAPAAQSRNGLGLGLTIVKQLADRLDLELVFDSVPGRGTRAGIVLPLADTAEQSGASDAVGETLCEFDNAPLVLLVEDENDVRDALFVLLTDWGCQVIAAASGREALELLSWADVPPAAMIVDRRLAEGEDGIDTIQAIRADVLDDVPAVLLTGDIYRFEGAQALTQLTILPKPAEPGQLHATLVDALAAARDG